MRRAIIAAAAAALAASGCDSGEAPQEVRSIKVRSQAQSQLHQANDLNRAIALKRAIQDSGYTCKRITRSGYVGDYKNLEMWAADCADRRQWAIFIGPDGSAQIRDCRDVEAVGLPKCTIREAEGSAGNAAG